jgi:hypothetical protein
MLWTSPRRVTRQRLSSVMWRGPLHYSTVPRPWPRRPFVTASAILLVCAVGLFALCIRSCMVGDYVCLGPYYLSFARGYCRVVHEPWFFVPPYPVVGWPWVAYPLDKVGEYPLHQNAVYVPMWLLSPLCVGASAWCYRLAGRPRGAAT